MHINRLDINSIKDLKKVESAWKRLQCGKEMTVFQSFDWNILLFKEWKATKYTRLFSKISLYLIYEKELILILPCIIQKYSTKAKWIGRKKGIYILGEGSYSDYLNAIYTEISNEILDELFRRIKEDFPKLDFIFTDIIENTFMDIYLKRKNILPDSRDVAVAIKKAESLDLYHSLLSKHTRQNLRTALNRIEKDGKKYEIVVLSKALDNKLLDTLKQLHLNRMKEKEIKASKKDIIHRMSTCMRIIVKSHKEKHNNIVIESMKTMEHSVIVIVKIDRNIAGYLYGLMDGGTVRILQNCVDKNYSFYSPMFRGIYDYITLLYDNSEINSIDFTRGDEEYKYKLGGTETILNTFIFDSNAIFDSSGGRT